MSIDSHITTDTAAMLVALRNIESQAVLQDAWMLCAVSDEHPTLGALLGRMNEALGSNFSKNDWAVWFEDWTSIPGEVVWFMRLEILQYLFDDEAADALMKVLDL